MVPLLIATEVLFHGEDLGKAHSGVDHFSPWLALGPDLLGKTWCRVEPKFSI